MPVTARGPVVLISENMHPTVSPRIPIATIHLRSASHREVTRRTAAFVDVCQAVVVADSESAVLVWEQMHGDVPDTLLITDNFQWNPIRMPKGTESSTG